MTRPAARAARGDRQRDPPEQVELAGAVDAGRVLELAGHAGQAGARRPDEERRRDEHLGQHDRERRERDRDAEHVPQRLAQHARRPNTSSRPRPATAGGSTMGRSTTASRNPDPRNTRRASTNASGRPNAMVMTRLTVVVIRLSWSASRTAGVARAVASEPPAIERTTSTTTGRPRNRANRLATARIDSSPAEIRRGRVAMLGPPPGPGASAWLLAPDPSVTTTGAAGTRSSTGSPARQGPQTRSGTSRRRPGSATP